MAKPTTLEGAMKRLEELAAYMEREVSIDEAIAAYAESVKLIAFAEGKLEAARLRVEKLSVTQTSAQEASDAE